MPRRKLFKKPKNLNVLLSEQMVRRMDKLIGDGETRTDFIREAVDREIERRESAREEKK
jgi:Arc/MetJ-type ribon-helix-helix transcriptional regulator